MSHMAFDLLVIFDSIIRLLSDSSFVSGLTLINFPIFYVSSQQEDCFHIHGVEYLRNSEKIISCYIFLILCLKLCVVISAFWDLFSVQAVF